MADPKTPVPYVLNEREYQLLRKYVFLVTGKQPNVTTKPTSDDTTTTTTTTTTTDDNKPRNNNAAAFRSASRVFLLTFGSLKGIDLLLARLAQKSTSGSTSPSPTPTPTSPFPTSSPHRPTPAPSLVQSPLKLALSLSSLLYLHTTLHRILSRLRSHLLHEKVRSIQQRYPNLYAALTSTLTPALGASLSGLALSIYPATQLRIAIGIYTAAHALELGWTSIAHLETIRKYKPSWLGSWVLFALSQGQLFHAFIFDRDCFPESYGKFILDYTPEYIQRPPSTLSPKLASSWPSTDNVLDALAQIARLKWPPFISPILRPNAPAVAVLPEGVNPIISPITSRAHPAIQKLSCALIHPSNPSCFMAYLQQNLLVFPQLARFYAMYYGAMSVMRFKAFLNEPLKSLNGLGESVLRSTLAVSGAIGTAWASICFFQAIFPRAFLPQFRFFLGGLLGGCFQIFDRTPAGHLQTVYAARESVYSLWKVGVKHRWWKGIRGGDVALFAAALALINVVFEKGRNTAAGQDPSMMLVKVLRGEIEVGLPVRKEHDEKAAE
ncbi:hypothetical protein EDD37DRAFT_294221 [Exophiala viscosa]|uniref:Transmembrane protein 135 N-terminal domain-containing protein n=1 Tax=Exophiala viscosa TaxID=2486360 RepID=A0AAN6E904_9EURO|nr:hypothetical protein EDD36DRAFT_47315 [Exophiala viscosa]KAI1628124.1 hypothetical protein EDD37DRAFT_294221 [Exophiala viscosa]